MDPVRACEGNPNFARLWENSGCGNLNIDSLPSVTCSTGCDLGDCYPICQQTYPDLKDKFIGSCALYNVIQYKITQIIGGRSYAYVCSWIISNVQKKCSYMAKSQYNDGRSTPQGYLFAGNCQCKADERLAIVCCKDGEVFKYDSFSRDDYTPPLEGWCSAGTDRIVLAGSASPSVIRRGLAAGYYYSPQFPTFNTSTDSRTYCSLSQISCSIIQDTPTQGRIIATTTANNGRIDVYIGGNLLGSCNIPPSICEKTFNISSSQQSISGEAKLIVNGEIRATSTCSLQTHTPITSCPSHQLHSVPGGLCAVQVFASIYNPSTGVWEGENLIASSTYSGWTKDLQIRLDVGVKKVNNSVMVATCKYKKCSETESRDICEYIIRKDCTNPPTNTTEWRDCNDYWDCQIWDENEGTCVSAQCKWTGNKKRVYRCKTWDSNLTVENIYNPGNCDFQRGYKFTFNLDRNNFLLFKRDLENNLFNVDHKLSTINNQFLDGNSDFSPQISLKDKGKEISFKPNRHGYYCGLVGTVNDSYIYNKPDYYSITDNQDNPWTENENTAKNYRDYTSCTFYNGYNNNTTININNAGTYVIYNESNGTNLPNNLRSMANGSVPIRGNFGKAVVKFYVNPSEVTAKLEVGKPNISHPHNLKTPSRDYIVGYAFDIIYGVEKIGRFGLDMGTFWLTGPNISTNHTPLDEGPGIQTNTYGFTPDLAGTFSFCAYHDADDEVRSIQRNMEAWGNDESICSSITVYRYLCYQGFCYECPNEPLGTPPNLRSAGCKIVEPIKCKHYINSDCRSRGRE